MVRKKNRPRNPGRLARIAAMPCIVCGRWGVEVHHIKRRPDGQKYGMGQRAPDERTIPLCPTCHRLGPRGVAYHAHPSDFERNHGNECDLLEKTDQLLAVLVF